MTRISREAVLMQVAELISQRSTCSRASVGVVIAREGRILTTGYNGAPAGLPHCNHDILPCPDPDCGRPIHLGPHHSEDSISFAKAEWESRLAPAGCRVAVHAEANAIAYAARYGMMIEGAELFTTLSPCLPCAQLIVNSGIGWVFYQKRHRDGEGLSLLRSVGINLYQFEVTPCS